MFRVWLDRMGDRPARALAREIDVCLGLFPRFFQAVHPERDIPYEALRRLTAGIAEDADDRADSGIILLGRLIRDGRELEASVPVRAIAGIGNVNGQFAFNLARVPEEMSLAAHETFGPLSAAEMGRLWKAIRAELGGFDGSDRLRLAHQTWDNAYIVQNSGGAAHRFALWWRLQHYVDRGDRSPWPVDALPAKVTEIELEPFSTEYLTRIARVLFCEHDDALQNAFARLRKLDRTFNYVAPRKGPGRIDDQRPATLIMPCLGPKRDAGLTDLHRWCDHLFDLGRYLAERSTTYRK